MAKKYLSPLNLLNLTSDPGTAAEGDFYWNSSTNRLRIYFDGAWADVSSNTAFTNAANTFTTAQTITPATSLTGLTINAAASAKGLIIKANATTPGNLQEWQNSAGTALAYFASNGQLYLTQHTSITQGKGITWNNGDNYITGLSGYHIQFTTYDGTSGQNEAMRIMGGSIASGGARVGIGSTAPGSKLQVNTAATGEVGLIVRGIASQTADLIQAQNSAGSVVFKVSPTGVINAGGATTIGNILNFSDPGIGVETKFNFLRATDSAWLAVNEYASDQTYYEFGMSDNPGSGDYYQWRFDEWTAPGHGWMPLQIGAYITRFIAPSITQYGNIALNPYNTPFATVNAAATSAANYTVSRYAPTNGTSYSLNKDTGTGTGTVTLNTQSYTGTNIRNYWIEIETGATTFKWGIDSSAFGGTIATGVAITGSAQTLDNGLQVTLSTTGHVAGDRWSWQSSPRRTTAIGGSPVTGAMQIIYPSSGLVGSIIRGASGQTASLQEWQNNSATALAYVSASGNFFIPGIRDTADTGSYINMNAAGAVSILTRSATNIGLIVKGAASQSANLTEWQNNAGTILARVQSNGVIRTDFAAAPNDAKHNSILMLAGTDATLGALQLNLGIYPSATSSSRYSFIESGDSTDWRPIVFFPSSTTTGAGRIGIGTVAPAAKIHTVATAATSIPLIAQGTASQSANLQEWQNSSSTVVSFISPVGRTGLSLGNYVNNATTVYLGDAAYGFSSEGGFLRYYTSSAAGGGHIWYAGADSSIPRASINNSGLFVLRGISSQTADLQQWQNSTGGVLGGVTAGGSMYVARGTALASTALGVSTGAAGNTGIVVRGETSQSANLQEWQNSSATVLASVSSAGAFTVASLTVSGDLTVNGTTTNINTTNLVVEDKNIILGDVTTPSNTTADGGGITLKGATDKTFNWVNATGSWTSSEPISAPRLLAGTGSLIGESALTINGTAENDDSQIIIKKPNQSLSSILAWDGQVYYGAHVYYNDATWVHDAPSGNTNNSLMAQVPGTGMQWYASNNSSGSWNVVSGVTLWDSSGVWKATVNTGNTVTAASFIPTSSTAPTNGMYLPAANTIGFATNSTSRIQINSIGETSIGGTPSGGTTLAILRSATGSTSMYGIYSTETAASDVTSLYTSIRGRPRTAAASFTLNSAVSFESNDIVLGAGSAVTNHIHYYVNATSTSASNVYGFRSDLNSAANVYGLYMNGTADNYLNGNTTFNARIISTRAWNAADNLGQIYLNGATGNRIDFANTGINPPAFTTRSVGTKLVLFPNIQAAAVDYALGIESSNLWFSTPNSGTGFKWYGGQTNIMTLRGDGTASLNSTSSTLGDGSVTHQLGIVSGAATNIGLVVRAAASQTGDLQQWQNSAGTNVARVLSDGQASFGTVYTPGISNTSTGSNSYVSMLATGTRISTALQTNVALAIQNTNATPTGNLTEWRNTGGTAIAIMSASGAFSAVTKSFDISHPTKENMRLRYGSLEGPENGVYVRGRSKENFICLPDYWAGLVDEDTITVNITPVGKKQDIYVDSILDNKVYLGGKIKEYFFTVYGERKDVDKLIVEY